MPDKDWKKRLDVVYSTNPNYKYDEGDNNLNCETIDPDKQKLQIKLDKKNRKGKEVTLIIGFIGSDDDIKDLSKLLKTKCGVGGSIKDAEIIIQGDHKDKVLNILLNEGYTKSRII